MIQLENVGVRRENWVLRKISLEIPQGAMLGVVGASGAGKTTLLKAIAGFLDVVEGSVLFDGKKIIGPTDKLVPGYEEIQLVNQDFALDKFHTVEQNIREKVLHLPKEIQRDLIEELLGLLELNALSERQARWLSGGEQQRLAIARALACEPRVLLLDEPFVHLDQRLRMKVMQYLSAMNEVRQTTIVLVSHDGSEMMGFVERILHLENGRIQRQATAQEMFYHPESKSQALLMGMINEARIDGKTILFRPSEYALEEPKLALRFLRAYDNGMVVYNYFSQEKGEEIVLTSQSPLTEVRGISIKKQV